MRIACVSTSRIPADTANSIQVMKVCQGLVKLGHEGCLLLPDFNGRTAREWSALAEQYGLSRAFEIAWLPSVPALQRNDFALRAVFEARRRKADLLYTWAGQSAAISLWLGLPVVYEIHDLPTGRLGPLWFKTCLRAKGRKAFAIITRALRQALERRYGALPDQEVVIAPNGVDLEQYERLPSPEEARDRLGLPQGKTVLCAGHLYAGRGVELFLQLAQCFPQASFVWVGGREEDVQTQRQIARQKGLQNVLFTGFIPNQGLPCYQAAADVLLMPYAQQIAGSGGGNSADICSPMKMFDYLAAGRAILSSDLPVIHEVLGDQNACFAPPEDAQAWEKQLARLLEDDALRARLAARAKGDARQYGWDRREENILRVFR